MLNIIVDTATDAQTLTNTLGTFDVLIIWSEGLNESRSKIDEYIKTDSCYRAEPVFLFSSISVHLGGGHYAVFSF